MSKPPLLSWTDEALDKAISSIANALRSEYPPGIFRSDYREVRDFLHTQCVLMEDSGAADLHEEVYHCIFDALAAITEAQRGKIVKAHNLHTCIILLRRLRALSKRFDDDAFLPISMESEGGAR